MNKMKVWMKACTKKLSGKCKDKRGDLTTQQLGLMILAILIVGVLITFLVPAFRDSILPSVRDRLIGLFS